MAKAQYPLISGLSARPRRRIESSDSAGLAIHNSRVFPPVPSLQAKYKGPSARSVRYLGTKLDTVIHLGTGLLFP